MAISRFTLFLLFSCGGSMLALQSVAGDQPKYPLISFEDRQTFPIKQEGFKSLVAEMDSVNMQVLVNLNGHDGNRLKLAVVGAAANAPGRFQFFANLDLSGIDMPDYATRTAARLEEEARRGAVGLKFIQKLGAELKDINGSRIHLDDKRLDPVFEVCARLKMPVLLQTSDVAQTVSSAETANRRWAEMADLPGGSGAPDAGVLRQSVIAEHRRRFTRNPDTVFVTTQIGWLGDELGRLGKLMDECHNLYALAGGVLPDPNRIPRSAREWFAKHQDRVLFGKDSVSIEGHRSYFHALEGGETSSKGKNLHKTVDLPDEVLMKLYFKNALRLIPAIDPKPFPVH